MIEFKLTPAQKQVKELTHWFAENEMRPISLLSDKLGKVPDEWLAKVNKMGITLSTGGIGGGGGGASSKKEDKDVDPEVKRQTNRTTVIASEEVGWGDPAIALSLPGPGLGGPPVVNSGTPEQKERFLGIFTKDEPRWGAYALTEPEAGSDVSNIRTTATKVDGGYILNGTKIFITNGGRASWVVAFATVDRNAGRAGHRAFVVEKGTPGFRCSRLAHKMGMRANETAELVFEDCFVPDENLLGGEAYYAQRASGKSGFQVAMATFDNTRPVVAAMATGIAQAAYDYTLDFVKKEYPKSGRLYQIACEKLADMRQSIHAGRLLVWEAAWKADIGQPNSKEAAICKAYAGKNALKVCETCLELMGPIGLDGHLVEKLYRDVKVYDIFEGTNQVQHLIVARRLYDAYDLRI
ncbi:acyl-CoA dehydrogenase family protein [Alicyclobacillus cycloheptanicus]|uniref:Acyl-CoA dehydrogenase n=1 Tax=Alicyclobacillus cycloheptanicus TaxID=1457 RepID=A0ABT9XM54_9BACL|nr:acyl-CoA dehydrogenase family protein [Alicyclobacillus cycloheptanicus]MDQ0191399.1 acyl-CoA dehydrogenase [Alicyclobacillus cycloheptanicus]WDM00335.1 acyl-CoA dehydrogenase family protein [Alicyclobacillus cycloheptanicus]